METNNGENLDLAQILATLANLPKTDTSSYESQQQFQDSNQSFESLGGTPEPHSYEQPPYPQPKDPRLESRSAPLQHRQPLPRSQTKTRSSVIDPSTITEWKHGLRCVSKIAVQNPDFVASVRKLIKDQERNVKDWEAGRTRLIEDQRIKRENEQTHRAALSLPGLLAGTSPLRTPEQEQEELTQYDLKVYRACKQMVDLQASTLKGLGIPFFGVKQFLILAEGTEPSLDESIESQPTDQTGGKITKSQLLELQRKMLNHLMELYGD